MQLQIYFHVDRALGIRVVNTPIITSVWNDLTKENIRQFHSYCTLREISKHSSATACQCNSAVQ